MKRIDDHQTGCLWEAESIHAHPTLSETVMEAAEVFFGMSTHLDRPKK
jgi:hypothetical protein